MGFGGKRMDELGNELDLIRRIEDGSMAEPIKAESMMTYLDFRKFTLFTHFDKGNRFKLRHVAVILIALLLLSQMIVVRFQDGFEEAFAELVIYIPGITIIVAAWISYIYNIKRNYKKSRIYETSVEKFTFSQDGMQVETVGEGMTGNVEFKYNALYRICEVKDTFYIYVGPSMAYLVQKRDMDGKTSGALATLLKMKLGNKYIVCF
jgi:hypothetical protein